MSNTDRSCIRYAQNRSSLALANFRISNPNSPEGGVPTVALDLSQYVSRNVGTLLIAQIPVATTALPPPPPLPQGLVNLIYNPTGVLNPTGLYQFRNTFSVPVEVTINPSGSVILAPGVTSSDFRGYESFSTKLLLNYATASSFTSNIVAGTTLTYYPTNSNFGIQYYGRSGNPIGSAFLLAVDVLSTNIVPDGVSYFVATFLTAPIVIGSSINGNADATTSYTFNNTISGPASINISFNPNTITPITVNYGTISAPVTGITSYYLSGYTFDSSHPPVNGARYVVIANNTLLVRLISLGRNVTLVMYDVYDMQVGSSININDNTSTSVSILTDVVYINVF